MTTWKRCLVSLSSDHVLFVRIPHSKASWVCIHDVDGNKIYHGKYISHQSTNQKGLSVEDTSPYGIDPYCPAWKKSWESWWWEGIMESSSWGGIPGKAQWADSSEPFRGRCASRDIWNEVISIHWEDFQIPALSGRPGELLSLSFCKFPMFPASIFWKYCHIMKLQTLSTGRNTCIEQNTLRSKVAN